MGFFGKLEAILKARNINLNIFSNIKIIINSPIKTNSDNAPLLIDETKQSLHLYPHHISNHISPEEEKQFRELLRDYRDEEKGKLVAEKKSSLLYRLNKYNSEGEDNEIIEYFHNEIPYQDYLALRDAYFIRKEFEKGRKSVGSILKNEVRNRFGIRGNNIVNLCSAGYFEELIKPLHEEFSQKDFEYYYELIIGKAAYALFVHSGMTEEEVSRLIKGKLEMAKVYGINSFHIHGIGDFNIKTINECLEKEKDFFKFEQKQISKKQEYDIIVVGLR